MTAINMNLIGETFNSSLISDEDIDLTQYLTAYDELHKLCTLLGTIFGFVASEIMSKMNILRSLKNNDLHGHFNTMKSMISHEKMKNLLDKSDYVSGSRTLLRLHRGLAFISLFFTKVHQLGMHDETMQAGRDAYDETLSHYHTWYVRSGAKIAMYTLPTKEALLEQVCPDNISQCEQALPRMLEVLDIVYNRIQKYYAENNLLDLP